MSRSEWQGLIKVDDARVLALDAVAKECGLIEGTASPFVRMIMAANAVYQLRDGLDEQMMAAVMSLQGTSIGFRTDRDKTDKNPNGQGYPMPVVRDCFIEATIRGLYPVGNEWNIIDGRMYVTKEGMGHLLKNIPGLKYMLQPGKTKIECPFALQDMDVNWKYNGEAHHETVSFCVRYTEKMAAAGVGIDAIIGKATKKARAWLYQYITGMELADGDDLGGGDVDVTPATPKRGRFASAKAKAEPAAEVAEVQAVVEDASAVEAVLEGTGYTLADLRHAWVDVYKWAWPGAENMSAYSRDDLVRTIRCAQSREAQGGQSDVQ